jgi:hypothetical protein
MVYQQKTTWSSSSSLAPRHRPPSSSFPKFCCSSGFLQSALFPCPSKHPPSWRQHHLWAQLFSYHRLGPSSCCCLLWASARLAVALLHRLYPPLEMGSLVPSPFDFPPTSSCWMIWVAVCPFWARSLIQTHSHTSLPSFHIPLTVWQPVNRFSDKVGTVARLVNSPSMRSIVPCLRHLCLSRS